MSPSTALVRALSALLLTSCCVGSSPLPGTSATSACPTNEVAAIGTACAPDGRLCGVTDPRFTHFILCSNGVWVEMEAPPPPPPSGT